MDVWAYIVRISLNPDVDFSPYLGPVNERRLFVNYISIYIRRYMLKYFYKELMKIIIKSVFLRQSLYVERLAVIREVS